MGARLKFWVLVILLISNVAVGGAAIFFLRQLDQKYSELVATGLPALNALRALTRDASALQRASLRATVTTDAAARGDELGRIDQSRRAIQATLASLEKDHVLNEGEFRALHTAARDYLTVVAEFEQEVRAGNMSAAMKLQRENLRAAYDRQLAVIDQTAQRVVAVGTALNEEYSSRMRGTATLLGALAGWPLITAILGLVVMLGLLLTLIISVFWPRRVSAAA